MSPADGADILRMLGALAFVLALMGGLAYVLKKLGLAAQVKSAGGKRRLKIIESMPLDARHRLVLIQRDNKQHLVILSANGETVVETDIEPLPDHEKTAA